MIRGRAFFVGMNFVTSPFLFLLSSAWFSESGSWGSRAFGAFAFLCFGDGFLGFAAFAQTAGLDGGFLGCHVPYVEFVCLAFFDALGCGIVRVEFHVVGHGFLRVFLVIRGDEFDVHRQFDEEYEKKEGVDGQDVDVLYVGKADHDESAYDAEYADGCFQREGFPEHRLHSGEPDVAVGFVVVQEFLVLEVFIAAVGCDDLIHDVRHVLLHLQHAVVQNEKDGREDNDKDDCQIHEWCSFFGFRCEKSARVGRRILISLQLFD